jgi:hypothetical protein
MLAKGVPKLGLWSANHKLAVSGVYLSSEYPCTPAASKASLAAPALPLMDQYPNLNWLPFLSAAFASSNGIDYAPFYSTGSSSL